MTATAALLIHHLTRIHHHHPRLHRIILGTLGTLGTLGLRGARQLTRPKRRR